MRQHGRGINWLPVHWFRLNHSFGRKYSDGWLPKYLAIQRTAFLISNGQVRLVILYNTYNIIQIHS